MISIYECDSSSEGGKTSGENILYTPGGLKPLKKKLSELAKNKNFWNLEVLESDTEFNVNFENALKIKIPKEFWEEFKNLLNFPIEYSQGVLKESSCFSSCVSVDLVEHLIDATPQEISDEIRHAVREFTELFKNKGFRILESEVARWLSLFGGVPLDIDSALIQHHHQDKYFLGLRRALTEEFSDDLGGIQVFRNNIKNGKLGKLPKFLDKNYIYGGKIQSVVEGKNLIFEILWDKNFRIVESIYIDKALLTEGLDTLGIGRVGSLLVPPKNKVFGELLNEIYSIIMEEE